MLKKYGKAIEQPQGPLPLHLPSEQMDGLTEPKRSRQDPCAGRSFAPPSPGQAALPAPRVSPFSGTPLLPTPSGECGCWKGKATPESRAMVTGEGLTG